MNRSTDLITVCRKIVEESSRDPVVLRDLEASLALLELKRTVTAQLREQQTGNN